MPARARAAAQDSVRKIFKFFVGEDAGHRERR
jgi:hypothetical protein